MKKIKFCCFAVNITHACIIANNFINNNLSNVKIIYINQEDEEKRVKSIISKFYKKMQDKMYYTEWLNEKMINDYANENFVFVIYGNEKFVENVNKYIEINTFTGYVINCYNIIDIKAEINNIIAKHDFYINTSGIYKREQLKEINKTENLL